MLKEFAAKKSVRLGKLLKERGGVGLGLGLEMKKRESGGPTPGLNSENVNSVKVYYYYYYEKRICTYCKLGILIRANSPFKY